MTGTRLHSFLPVCGVRGVCERKEPAVEVRDERVMVKERNDYNLSEDVDTGQLSSSVD